MASSTISMIVAVLIILMLSIRIILPWLVSFKLYKRYYAAVQGYWGKLTDHSTKMRRDLLREVRKKLVENGGDLLEIGSSSGINMEYMDLPTGSSYIALDYNPEMEGYMRENIERFPQNNIPLKKFIANDAAKMKDVKDDSISVVLATQLLCCLENDQVKATLKEIKRVLKPGGYYFFMEHVIDEPYTMRRAVAIMSVIAGLPVFFDGCRFDKETWKDIEEAGFQNFTYKKCLLPKYFDMSHPILTLLRYMSRMKIAGYGVK